jgi:hypothetical protein
MVLTDSVLCLKWMRFGPHSDERPSSHWHSPLKRDRHYIFPNQRIYIRSVWKEMSNKCIQKIYRIYDSSLCQCMRACVWIHTHERISICLLPGSVSRDASEGGATATAALNLANEYKLYVVGHPVGSNSSWGHLDIEPSSRCFHFTWRHRVLFALVLTYTLIQSTEKYPGFQVFTAVTMKNAVFRDVAPCGSCKSRRFGRKCRFHLQCRKKTRGRKCWVVVNILTN